VNSGDKASATHEWRAQWPLPVAAMVGFSTIGLQNYGFGAFAGSVEQAFGWTRAQTMFGVTVAMFLGIFLNIIVGLVIDRFGSRRVALTGVLLLPAAFALLGTATGSPANWWLLWTAIAVGVVLVQATVWMGPVAGRFDKSRGFALAVTLSGTSVAAMIQPKLGTWLIAVFGWRHGLMVLGGFWCALTLPVTLLWFRDLPRRSPEAIAAAPILSGMTFGEGVRTRAFWGLVVSFATFSFFSMSISTNLMLLLGEKGLTAAQAGSLFVVLGIVGLVARLSVGWLLDRIPGNLIGTGAQLLPVMASFILLSAKPSTGVLLAVIGAYGLAIGAELDVVLYQATRHFGLRAFGALCSGIITFGALLSAIGPFAAGWLHDRTGTYNPLLMLVMVAMTIGAVAMASTGRVKNDWSADREGA
jgi:nitrate/nitrite transporter NarK